jgi:hypothetical protein
MKKKNINIRGSIFAITIFLLIPLVPLYAIDNTEPPAQPVLPMVRAMGGAFTAVANDENAIFYNPAGYALIDEGIISVFSLGLKVSIDDSALKLYSAMIAGTNVFSPGNINTYWSNTTFAPAVAGPIFFGRVGNNFGFSFFDNINFTMDTRPGGILPAAELEANADIGFVGGYGLELPFLENLYAGLNVKVLLRSKTEVDGTVLGVIDAISDTSETPLSKAVGFGADFGMLYFPYTWFSLGIAAKDFFGTRFSTWEAINQSKEFGRSMIKPRLAFGTAFYPLRVRGEPKNFQNFIVALEYSDLLDYTSVFSNIQFGISFNTLKILTLRGGIEGGYPAMGIGFDLNFFHTSVVYFIDELGAFAGATPVQNLMLNFDFNW